MNELREKLIAKARENGEKFGKKAELDFGAGAEWMYNELIQSQPINKELETDDEKINIELEEKEKKISDLKWTIGGCNDLLQTKDSKIKELEKENERLLKFYTDNHYLVTFINDDDKEEYDSLTKQITQLQKKIELYEEALKESKEVVNWLRDNAYTSRSDQEHFYNSTTNLLEFLESLTNKTDEQ